MRRFGSDKPDLRIQGLELQDLAQAVEGTEFRAVCFGVELPADK